MNNLARGLIIVVCVVLGSACAARAPKPAATPTATAFGAAEGPEPSTLEPVWRAALLTDECPVMNKSQAVQTESVLRGLSDTGIGYGIDAIFAAVFKAIREAAKADRDGKTFSTVHAWNFYAATRPSAADAWKPFDRARCIVIARGAHAPNGGNWCAGADVSENAQQLATCRDPVPIDSIAKELQLGSPSFYAEIALHRSAGSGALVGDLSYVWYPAPLTSRSGTTRDLLIGAALRKPHPDVAKGDVYAAFSFPLPGLTPGTMVPLEASTRWRLPFGGSAPPEPRASALRKAGAHNITRIEFGPVNRDVFVQETGDLNALLQFADGLLENTDIEGQLVAGVKGVVVPGLREAAEAASDAEEQAAAAAARESARALCKARSEYLAALATEASPDSDAGRTARTANLDLLWLQCMQASDESAAEQASACKAPTSQMH